MRRAKTGLRGTKIKLEMVKESTRRAQRERERETWRVHKEKESIATERKSI